MEFKITKSGDTPLNENSKFNILLSDMTADELDFFRVYLLYIGRIQKSVNLNINLDGLNLDNIIKLA